MELSALKDILQQNGIIGAGGAGFPSYAKLDERADTVILNCAECEPLLKLHRQLLEHKCREIMSALDIVRESLGAKRAIIGIKSEYHRAVAAMEENLTSFPALKICRLKNVYPMGDEVVLIYEATGRVVRPGGLPIEEGVIVYNVETVYNIYEAVTNGYPVTEKLVSVVAAVKEPKTVLAPIGMSLKELVEAAGGSTCKDEVYLVGGPMMGRILPKDAVVTKTTNAVLVLPPDHMLVMKRHRNCSTDLNRAASICCQCNACTDLCPRNQLGHPIDPATFMRVAGNRDFSDTNLFLDTMYCSGCGVCEMYACPQSLSPRSILLDYKNGLRINKVAPNPSPRFDRVDGNRRYRQVPEKRLTARLDLLKYEHTECGYDDRLLDTGRVSIPLNSHIGAPSTAVVEVGSAVYKGQLIAEAAKGLSVATHASISGIVSEISRDHIVIVGR